LSDAPTPQAPPAPRVNGSAQQLFGGPTRLARDGADELRFAVVPLPTYQTPSRTLEKRLDAISATYTGRWEQAVDLYRGTVGEDGFFDGILKTMSHGLLGLPLEWQGDETMRLALLDAGGTPGDFTAMHPEEECSKIFEDFVGLGQGLGQYLLMCWRCGGVDLDRVDSTRGPIEVCRRCDAARLGRPAGKRELFQLQWRDPRWVWQDPMSFRMYYQGRQTRVEIVDGDGEWVVFRSVPSLESWRHGPWIWATLAAIFSRDACYDAQNTSAVCAPTPVLRAVKPTTPQARLDAEKQLKELLFNNKMVLEGEWLYEIVSASADYIEICEKIVARCSDAFETGITGNVMGRAARAAFADASIYARTTSDRRRFYGGSWIRQLREKGLRWWGLDNFGTSNVPVGTYDVRSPEDKLAEAKSLEAWGNALSSYRNGLDAHGLEAEQADLIELMQRLGRRVKPKSVNANTSKLDLGVDALMAVVRGGPALESLGLPRFGDQRDDMTLAQLAALTTPAPPTTAAPPALPPSARRRSKR
jgi:hypothetical protein